MARVFTEVTQTEEGHYVISLVDRDGNYVDMLIASFSTKEEAAEAAARHGWPAPSLFRSRSSYSGNTLKERKKKGLCPKCGRDGAWIRTALVCSEHGAYAGF